MLSLPTPPKCFAASVLATLHAAFARKVRARPSDFSTFEAIWVHLRYGPATRSPSLKMALSIGFRMLSFLPSCYSSYGAWTFTPVGLAPTDHASLRWTHTPLDRSLPFSAWRSTKNVRSEKWKSPNFWQRPPVCRLLPESRCNAQLQSDSLQRSST